MSDYTKEQNNIVNMFTDYISKSFEIHKVKNNTLKIITPFIDWKGENCYFYITSSGKITDGGYINSQLKSLRLLETFDNWSFKNDFISSYNIQIIDNRFIPIIDNNGDCLIRYIQGISRLLYFFEKNPIKMIEDKFPTFTRQKVKEAMREIYQSNKDPINKMTLFEIDNRIKNNIIYLNSGIIIENDMNPKNNNTLIKIISHHTSNKYDKKQHVESKVLSKLLWEREKENVQLISILKNIELFPEESQKLIKTESKNIIELYNEDNAYKIVEILTN